MRVFITGASSGIMLPLLQGLIDKGHELWCLSRLERQAEEGILWIQGDLGQPDNWIGRLEECDLVIHAAAVTHCRSEAEYMKVNLESTRQLVDQLIGEGAPGFLYISSRTAGMESGGYGKSKYLAEQYIRKKLPASTIIRPSEVYGGGSNEGIDKWIEDCISKKILICPVGIEDLLWPIHKNDMVNGILKLIESPARDSKPIIMAGSKGFSMLIIARRIGELRGNRHLIVPIPVFVLKLIGLIIKLIPLPFGPVPDQIPRLLARKEIGTSKYEGMLFDEYLMNTVRESKP